MKNWFADSSKVYRLSKLFFSGIFLCLTFANFLDFLSFNDLTAPSGRCHSCVTNVTINPPSTGWAFANIGFDTPADILRLNQGQWAWQSTPLSQYDIIQAVATDSTGDGWALAQQFHAPGADTYVTLHERGGTWRIIGAAPSIFSPSSFSMRTSSDGWVTGCDTGSACGIYHFDGTSWTLSPTNGNASYNSLSMLSATDGWAVGVNGAIAHFIKGIWQPVISPIGDNLNSVVMLSPTNGFAVGDSGMVFHFDGNKWAFSAFLPRALPLTSLVMFGPNEGWAAEGHFDNFSTGFVRAAAHYHNGTWSDVPLPSGPQFTSLAMVAPNEGWAVGFDDPRYDIDHFITQGQGVFAHYQNGAWHITPIIRTSEALWITLARLGLGLILALAVIGITWLWVRSFAYPRGTPFNSWWARFDLLGSIIFAGATFIFMLEPILFSSYQTNLRVSAIAIGIGGMLITFICMFGILIAFRKAKPIPDEIPNQVI